MSTGKKETLVEEGTTFRGAIESNNPIVVKGRLEGEVSGPSLHVSAGGEVSGIIRTKEIHSEGVLEGEFEADVVRLSGQVKDKTRIRAKELDVRLSPERGKMEVVFGEVSLDVGDVPDKTDALTSAQQALTTDSAKEATAAAQDAPADDQATASSSDADDAATDTEDVEESQQADSEGGGKNKKGKNKHKHKNKGDRPSAPAS